MLVIIRSKADMMSSFCFYFWLLVKCRKVGAKNWGNKSKKENVSENRIWDLDEKCWKGYEKKGMKKMFGKMYPNCVKKEEYKLTLGG